ncbi:MAG: DUF59 domain-containing protein [Planctomycetes bacterium]|nr:DUF59 domain-containing protein [Planctomycetota bacterium]
MTTIDAVYNELKQVFDPEIPVNIVDLGLVYDVKIEADKVLIQMTLTSQACPEAKTIPDVMKRRIKGLDGVGDVQIDIVWNPPWSPHKISEAGRAILGIEDDQLDTH